MVPTCGQQSGERERERLKVVFPALLKPLNFTGDLDLMSGFNKLTYIFSLMVSDILQIFTNYYQEFQIGGLNGPAVKVH